MCVRERECVCVCVREREGLFFLDDVFAYLFDFRGREFLNLLLQYLLHLPNRNFITSGCGFTTGGCGFVGVVYIPPLAVPLQ